MSKIKKKFLNFEIYEQSEIDTISGSLSDEIDGDITIHEGSSSHDSRYYTEDELNAGQLDNRYYTETEVNTISGTLSAEINSDVAAAITALIDSAPGALDTLNELAAAMGDDQNFATTITTLISTISGALSSEIDSDISTHESGSSHDSRYYTETELNNGQLDNRYYTETEIDTISGSLSDEIDSDVAAESSVLSAEIDSDIITFSGTIDHDTLVNYSADEHFTEASIDKYTQAEVDTISGSLSSEIDGDITTHESGSSHDSRYYTETEIDTISGSLSTEIDDDVAAESIVLSAEIDSDIATFSGTIDHDTILNTHDLTTDIDHGSISGLNDDDHSAIYYNKTAVDGKWTTWSGTIDHDTIINTHDLTTDIDHDAIDNYAIGQHRIINDSGTSATELWSAERIDTLSGTLSAEIDSDITIHEAGSSHDGRYYTESEVNTISGSLSTEIDDDITTHSADTTSVHGITDTSDLGLKSGNVNQFNDITSTGANIEDAVTKKHDESHTITSHSDITDATGAQIEELTGGGDTTLHLHSDTYYTETEVDDAFATFSGTIDHNTIINTHNLTTDITGAVEAAGLTLDSTKVIDSADENLLFNFGRAFVGHMGTNDIAAFGHRDCATTTDYALAQANSGTININASTGQNINFRINAVLKAELNANGLTLHVISAEGTDVDKFLVSNSGLVKYRTGAQVLADIDATSADAAIVDHAIVRGHGGAKIVQDTGITVDDNDVMTLPASSAIVCPEKLVIPLNEPTSLVNGCIWIV